MLPEAREYGPQPLLALTAPPLAAHVVEWSSPQAQAARLLAHHGRQVRRYIRGRLERLSVEAWAAEEENITGDCMQELDIWNELDAQCVSRVLMYMCTGVAEVFSQVCEEIKAGRT